jgi:hypothetical protein
MRFCLRWQVVYSPNRSVVPPGYPVQRLEVLGSDAYHRIGRHFCGFQLRHGRLVDRELGHLF